MRILDDALIGTWCEVCRGRIAKFDATDVRILEYERRRREFGEHGRILRPPR